MQLKSDTQGNFKVPDPWRLTRHGSGTLPHLADLLEFFFKFPDPWRQARHGSGKTAEMQCKTVPTEITY